MNWQSQHLGMLSQEGTVVLDTLREGISLNLLWEEQAGVRSKDTAHLGQSGALVAPAVLSAPRGTKLPRERGCASLYKEFLM